MMRLDTAHPIAFVGEEVALAALGRYQAGEVDFIERPAGAVKEKTPAETGDPFIGAIGD